MAETIRHYTLPPEEVLRVREAGGPLVDLQMPEDKLREMSIAAVEVDGQIVAYWAVWYGLHVEPLWVQADQRKNPAVIKGIVLQMQAIVAATGEPAAFAVIDDATAEVVAQYATRLGFHPAPSKLYYLVLEPLAPAVTV